MKKLILAIAVLAAMACATCSIEKKSWSHEAKFKCSSNSGITHELIIDSFDLVLTGTYPDNTSDRISMHCDGRVDGDGYDDKYRRYQTVEKFDKYGIRTSVTTESYSRYSTCRYKFDQVYSWFKKLWNLDGSNTIAKTNTESRDDIYARLGMDDMVSSRKK